MSPEVRQYITKLRNEIKSGKKKTDYGDQYKNNRSTHQQNNTQQAAGDQEKDDNNENQENSKKAVKFTLAGNLSRSKARQQNVHCWVNHEQRVPEDKPEDGFMSKVFMDNGSDTCGIGGPAWIIDSVSQRKVSISGYDASDTTQKDVPIVAKYAYSIGQ